MLWNKIILFLRLTFSLLCSYLHSTSSVSQYSDENMMQPYNLAVCFGPNLVRGPHEDDFVTLQPQINFLVKNLIIQQESIFPTQSEVPGPMYEKCMTLDQDDWYSVWSSSITPAQHTVLSEVIQINSSFSEPINEEGEVEDSTQLKDGKCVQIFWGFDAAFGDF